MNPNFSLFSEESQEIAQHSYAIALRYHQNHISREHILLAFFETSNQDIVNLLSKLKIDIESIKKRLEYLVSNRVPIVPTKTLRKEKPTTSPVVKHFIENSQPEMKRLGEKNISSEILFLSLIQSYFTGPDADKTLQEILTGFGLRPDNIRKELLTKLALQKTK